MKHALRNYFTNPEATVRELMQVDPELALKVHQGLQPKAAQVPSAVREYEYVQGLPEDQRSGYMDFRRSMVPSFMSPITLGPYDEYIGGGAQGGETTATGPNGEKVRLNPQTGQWEPMGGAAGNASPQTFPVGG